MITVAPHPQLGHFHFSMGKNKNAVVVVVVGNIDLPAFTADPEACSAAVSRLSPSSSSGPKLKASPSSSSHCVNLSRVSSTLDL